MYNIISTFSYILEFLIAFYFLNNVLLCKMKQLYIIFIGITLYSIALVNFIIIDNSAINTLLFFLINFIFAFFCFKSTIKEAILSSLFLTVSMLSTEFVSMSILSMTHNNDINIYKSNIITYLLTIIFCKTMYFMVVIIVAATGLKLTKNKKTRTPTFLFLFPVCTLVVIFTFWMIASEYDLNKNMGIIISVANIAIIMSVILTYVFYSKTSNEIENLYKSQREAEKITTDTEYYAMLDRQNEILKCLIHDEKNHLSAIKSLTNNQEVDDYINQIMGQINNNSFMGNTNNKMLDLILNKYQYACEKEKIDFYISIKTANFSYIENPDLISMMSNLLDNAIESARKSSEKGIDLSINRTNNFDILTCSNSCDNVPKVSGGTLLTTKSGDGFHGIGVRSIKKIVCKYNGNFEWSYNGDEKRFVVYIAFKSLE